MKMGFFSLVLALLLHACYAQLDFTSIDCGGTTSYEDSIGIQWQADPTSLINSGFTLPPVFVETLKYFPQTTSSSNCYTLTVRPNRRHLIRASFYYGNYDDLSYSPTFNLYIDGNFWTQVSYDPLNSDNRLGYYMIKEIIVKASKTDLSICLKSGTQDVPFISGLESRLLPVGSYEGYTSWALHMLHRINLGARSLVRYPKDSYDRFWFGVPDAPAGFNVIKTDKTIAPSGLSDQPPVAVFNSAFEGQKNLTVVIYELDLETHLTDFYIMVWFLDFRDRKSASDVCTFQTGFQVDKTVSISGTKTLEPGITSGWITYFTFPATEPKRKLKISLYPSPSSTLPPVLNAVEVYAVANKTVTQGTSSNPKPLVPYHITEENVAFRSTLLSGVKGPLV